jgi:two-component system LytT family response regulator
VSETLPLRILIADDELLARRRLSRLCAALPGAVVVGEVESADEVLARVREGGLDVVLLDVQMPGLSGVDAMQLWPEGGPHVVLCTAHADHALAAFDVGAVDYLLKPVEPARLARALERVRRRVEPPAPLPPAQPAPAAPLLARLALPTHKGVVLLDPMLVSHALLDGELVTVYTAQGDFLCDYSLQELEEKLPADRFERVHRRAILNLAEVVRLEPLDTGGYIARTSRGHSVEVSRQSARELRRRLGLR